MSEASVLVYQDEFDQMQATLIRDVTIAGRCSFVEFIIKER